MKHFLTLLLFVFPLLSFAWDGTGHKIIAAIAYEQLTPQTKQKIDRLTELLDPGYPAFSRFLYISALPDRWRKTGEYNGKLPHYTSWPWSSDGTSLPMAPSINILSILTQNKQLLADPKASEQQKAVALTYLTHLVGDLHQPLHCGILYTQEQSHGDAGGVKFPIKSRQANNLHTYWDRSAKLLASTKLRYPLSHKDVSRLAAKLQRQYSPDSFENPILETDFNQWATQCFQLLQQGIYPDVSGTSLSAAYKKQLRTMAGRQMVLAGDRLAFFLNHL